MNLWADFDTNHVTQPVPVSTTRPRRLTEQGILSLVRNWLLCDYVPAYCHALAASRIFRRCYWVDALGDEQKTATLSSIETLQRQLSQEQRPIALHALLLTGKSKRRAAKGTMGAKGANGAQAPSSLPPLPKEGGIIRANWLDAAPTLLAEIAQSPAICLLNPCGQGGHHEHTLFSYNDLLPVYQRTLPTELLLWVSYRQLEGHLTQALHSSTHAAALTALLRTDRWKTLSLAPQDVSQSISTLLGLLIASVQRHFHFPVQRLQFPLLLRPALVDVAPASLLFATRRQDSLSAMNDAVCLYRRHIYEQSHRGLLTEEWFRQQQQEQEMQARQQMSEYLLLQGRTQRIRRWPDLRQHALLSHFGQLTIHDYNALIIQLLASNEVRCEWKRTLTLREHTEMAGELGHEEGANVPGNDDTLLWR